MLATIIAANMLLWGCGSNSKADFNQAQNAFVKKDYDQAERLARRVLAQREDFVPAYLLLGRIGLAREDENSATLNYRSAYDMASNRKFRLRAEDLQAASGDLRLSWQEAAFFLADVEFKTQNYNRAIQFYDAVSADETSPDWRKRALDAKQATREFVGYVKTLDSLRSQNYKSPNNPTVQAEMSALFLEMASGLTRLGKMKSVPDRLAMAAKFREQAQEALEAIYGASPEVRLPQTEALIAYTDGQEQLMRGKYEDALERVLIAAEKDPSNGKYQFSVASIMAVVATRKKDPSYRLDERETYVKRAVELEPKTWRYQTAYAGILRDRGRPREAFDALVKAREVTQDADALAAIDAALAALEKEIGAGGGNR